MAYDQHLADRISGILKEKKVAFDARKMMGGLCYMINDKMALGVIKDSLMIRIDPELYDQSLRKKGVRQMDFTGKVLKGFLLVDPPAIDMQRDLEYWILLCLDFNPRAKSSKKASQNPTIFCPTNEKDWRQWLRNNHKSSESVWVVLYKKNSGVPAITWDQAVNQALCFGWIDGKRLSISDEKFKQFFCRRKPKGTWSRINKEKVDELIRKRMMTKAGYESIAVSKQNGSWNVLDQVEALTIPKDLEMAFKNKPGSRKAFSSLSKSTRKLLLTKLMFAKRPETRKARIGEILAAFAAFLLLLSLSYYGNAQQRVFDVHVHGAREPQTQLERLNTAGVYKIAISTSWDLQQHYGNAGSLQVLRGLMVPCPNGKVPYSLQPCFKGGEEWPPPDWVEAQIRAGNINFMGEVLSQYHGISSSDTMLLPYYRLARKHNIPVGIHTGSAGPDHGCPNFKQEFGNPLLMETLLKEVPGLRVWIMHAGAPYHREAIDIMTRFPQVYTDLSAINNPNILSSEQFANIIKLFIDSGLEDRIMFGSDNSDIDITLKSVAQLTFLTENQKEKIFYLNAERFFESKN